MWILEFARNALMTECLLQLHNAWIVMKAAESALEHQTINALHVTVENIFLQLIPVLAHVQMDSMVILQIGNVMVRNQRI